MVICGSPVETFIAGDIFEYLGFALIAAGRLRYFHIIDFGFGYPWYIFNVIKEVWLALHKLTSGRLGLLSWSASFMLNNTCSGQI